MQALMMQDRKQLRAVFEEFDTERRGQLTVDQFYKALCKLVPHINISYDTAAELVKRSNDPLTNSVAV